MPVPADALINEIRNQAKYKLHTPGLAAQLRAQ